MRKFLAAASLFLLCILSSNAENYEWKAQWITHECDIETNTWISFCKIVDIDAVPPSLIARISADSKYWLWINGKMVIFEGNLKRGPKLGDGYYDKVEIAPYLRKGQNIIAVEVWYFGRNGFSHNGSGSCALLFDAQGEGLEILSDRSWKARKDEAYMTADVQRPNYRICESNVRYDARLGNWNWLTDPTVWGEYDITMAMPCKVGEAPFGNLVERPIPFLKDYGMKEYVDVRRSGDTLYCKLPYNCQFSPYLKVEAPAGRLIKLWTDHTMFEQVMGICGEYVTRDGVQEYESLPYMTGEEMQYIVPSDVKVLEVKYHETGYDTELAGSFSCDDPILTKFWKKAQRTDYVCMRDNYSDCPDRERAQWPGDAVNELNEAFYAFDRKSDLLARKCILEIANWQRPDGSMYGPVPTSNYYKELPYQIMNIIGWHGARNYWFYSGDEDFIPLVYDKIHKYLHVTWKLDSDGIPIYRKGDWDWIDGGDTADKRCTSPIWYYLALKSEVEMAKKLGREKDVAEDKEIMDRLAASFNEKYWNGSAYMSPKYPGRPDDHAQALAVIAGIVPEERYPDLCKVFDMPTCTSPFMFSYILDALFLMNEPQRAINKMRDKFHSLMDDKHSTLYEGWEHTGTSNHGWSGGGMVTMSKYIAGIEPIEPGFKKFKVAPQMGDLHHVEASVVTHYGNISVKLDRQGRTIKAEITVPEGTTAVVPTSKKDIVLQPGTHKISIK